MAAPKIGFRAAYGSNRALEADHSAYMTHGGLIVRCAEEEAPEPNTDMVLRICAPSGESFDLLARAGHYLKKKGIMVSFEEDKEARARLDGFVGSESFKGSIVQEAGKVEPPKFTAFDPATTPPAAPAAAAAPFDEATPIDSAAPFELPPLDLPPLDLPPFDDPSPPESETDSTFALHPDIDKVAKKPRARRRKAPDARHEVAPQGGTTIRKPAPGSDYPVYAVKYSTVADFAEAVPDLEKSGLLAIPYEETEANVDDCALLRVILPGRNQFELMGVVEKIDGAIVTVRVEKQDELLRKMVLYPTTIAARNRLEGESPEDRGPPTVIRITDTAPDEDWEKMPIRRRLARMGMDEKINLALSGNREERMALAMDNNRAVHHYLLKNAKITLDEISFMARLPSLNPDVLDKIAENPMYTQNPTVTKALVYNPKTPLRTAIRLLDRLPRPEIMNLAKRSNMNLRLVMAAKKRIERFKG